MLASRVFQRSFRGTTRRSLNPMRNHFKKGFSSVSSTSSTARYVAVMAVPGVIGRFSLIYHTRSSNTHTLTHTHKHTHTLTYTTSKHFNTHRYRCVHVHDGRFRVEIQKCDSKSVERTFEGYSWRRDTTVWVYQEGTGKRCRTRVLDRRTGRSSSRYRSWESECGIFMCETSRTRSRS